MHAALELTRFDGIFAADHDVGFADLPNQIHRYAMQRGFELNVMAVGEFFFFLERRAQLVQHISVKTTSSTWLFLHNALGFFGSLHLSPQKPNRSELTALLFSAKGESGLGKSTFLNSLFACDLYVKDKYPAAGKSAHRQIQIRIRVYLRYLREPIVTLPWFRREDPRDS